METQHYYPEMGEKRPDAQIEASLAHYGRHWFLATPLELKGQGIKFVDKLTDPRRNGWNRYKVTQRAFDKIQKTYTTSSVLLL